LIQEYKQIYRDTPKKLKPSVSTQVVEIWRSQDPPGRFLTKADRFRAAGSRSRLAWLDVGDAAARRKAAQCLREKTPKERSELPSTDNDTAAFEEEDDDAIVANATTSSGAKDATVENEPFQIRGLVPATATPSRSAEPWEESQDLLSVCSSLAEEWDAPGSDEEIVAGASTAKPTCCSTLDHVSGGHQQQGSSLLQGSLLNHIVRVNNDMLTSARASITSNNNTTTNTHPKRSGLVLYSDQYVASQRPFGFGTPKTIGFMQDPMAGPAVSDASSSSSCPSLFASSETSPRGSTCASDAASPLGFPSLMSKSTATPCMFPSFEPSKNSNGSSAMNTNEKIRELLSLSNAFQSNRDQQRQPVSVSAFDLELSSVPTHGGDMDHPEEEQPEDLCFPSLADGSTMPSSNHTFGGGNSNNNDEMLDELQLEQHVEGHAHKLCNLIPTAAALTTFDDLFDW